MTVTDIFPPEPKTPKATATRKLLLEIAAKAFVERGYDAVSLRDLAEEAKLTKGAIYGHFKSKGQLLVEVIRTQLAERDASYNPDLATSDPAVMFDQFLAPGSRELRLLQVDAAAAARHDPDVDAGLRQLNQERTDMIQASFDEYPGLDAETLTFIIRSLAGGIGMEEAVGTSLPDPERWRRTILPMFGLGRRP